MINNVELRSHDNTHLFGSCEAGRIKLWGPNDVHYYGSVDDAGRVKLWDGTAEFATGTLDQGKLELRDRSGLKYEGRVKDD
ncbi:hypothetical protein VT03_01955 [Planctomyces sp. SH-PL14]|nr:hypothetical protein VT03_01955 [Planctomyces sp. SH-PL14]